MRLFTATTLNDDIKEYLFKITEDLRNHTRSGRFTSKENFHITMNFIGESDNVEAIKLAMQEVIKSGGNMFPITIGGFGRFKRRGGDIYWLGIAKEPSLWQLQGDMTGELIKAGFAVEEREFKPHITLGRKITVDHNFQVLNLEEKFQSRKMDVTKISLMQSEHINGKLTYTEIFHINLK
ncbi:MAG: RNA 2',3'-cyclic phosphodiesterase [Clostridiales bacterium]|nr:RNA 2',3'-cyclic phosphodiesterase [Clostridiales bacterium]